MLTQIFAAPSEQSLPLWLAQTLARLGGRVFVLCAPPLENGTPAAGFSATTVSEECRDGVMIRRVPTYPSHDRSAIRRFTTFASFGLSSTWFGRDVLRSADLCFVYGSPATTVLGAIAAKHFRRIPYVFMVQDLWPDSIFATGFISGQRMAPFVTEVMNRLMAHVYRHAEEIIVISPGMGPTLTSRGVPASKITLIYNSIDEALVGVVPPNGVLRSQLGLNSDEFIIAYAGNHGPAQDLTTWLAAMSYLRDFERIHLVLIGSGVDRESLIQEADQMGLSRVHFLEAVQQEAIGELTADADALAISLAEDPLFEITMPGKTQRVLAQGKAIVCVAAGDTASLISRIGAGWVSRPGDAESLARVILDAWNTDPLRRDEMGNRGREFYIAAMSQKVTSRQLGDVVARALERHAGRCWRLKRIVLD